MDAAMTKVSKPASNQPSGTRLTTVEYVPSDRFKSASRRNRKIRFGLSRTVPTARRTLGVPTLSDSVDDRCGNGAAWIERT